MNEWSRRRKRVIFLLVFFALLVLVALPSIYFFYRAPTCFDGRQNGRETGIDCGGACQLLCTIESLPLLIEGDPRILSLGEGSYELVVLVENPNINGKIYRAGYTANIYGASSAIPVKVIEGETHVPKGTTFAVFEGPFEIEGGAIPSRATFAWKDSTLIWQTDNAPSPELSLSEIRLSREDTRPRLDAQVENRSIENISNIELIALLKGQNGNIFAASKTFVERLPSGESAPVVFTWPGPFREALLDTDILIKILPDGSFFR